VQRGAGSRETPPRTWGRRAGAHLGPACGGNTPTDVGKTKTAQRSIRTHQKHPHGRGEDPKAMVQQAVGLETPPRTWGRHHSVRSPQLKHGNTPTDVGKTIWHSTACIESRKHPHGRGEDPTIKARGYRLMETPPRTWGRPFSSLDGCILRRNTPTDVGKTQRRAHAATSVWKHPHGRGEDSSRAH